MVNATSSCSVEGCEKPAKPRRRGFCATHYRLDLLSRAPKCSVGDCDKPSESRGMCGAHAKQTRGRPMTCSEVECSQPAAPYRKGKCEEHGVRINEGQCSVDGCERPSESRGMCASHYYRFEAFGDPNAELQRHKGRVCSVEDCEDKHSGLGYCNKHLARFKRYGDPLEPSRREAGKVCSVDDCDNPHASKGYCDKHYRRWKKHGDPLFVPEVKATPVTTCEANGCDRPGDHCAGLCGAHYYRKLKYGDPNARTIKNVDNGGKCSVERCDMPYKQDGYCLVHLCKFNPDGTIKVSRDCRECGDPIDFLEVVDGRTLRSDATRCRICDTRRPSNPITTVELVFRDQNWNCHLCGKPVEFGRDHPHPLSPSVDHIIPLSRGGENTPENCALAHLRCNKFKHTRLPEELELIA